MSAAESPSPNRQQKAPSGFGYKRLLPLVLLGAGIAAFFALGLDRYLTFEQLREHRESLTTFVAAMPVTSVGLFILVYTVAVALSVPGAVILTLTGGFLFGIWEGTAAVVIGATAGATALFLAARFVLGDVLRAKAGPWLAKMEAGFNEDALSYLLVLRLIPAFPYLYRKLGSSISRCFAAHLRHCDIPRDYPGNVRFCLDWRRARQHIRLHAGVFAERCADSAGYYRACRSRPAVAAAGRLQED
jgi:hypothetical protein